MHHFGIIEMGKRGGPGVPFILSKIVAPSSMICHSFQGNKCPMVGLPHLPRSSQVGFRKIRLLTNKFMLISTYNHGLEAMLLWRVTKLFK